MAFKEALLSWMLMLFLVACRGLEEVAAAQDCLHSGQSVGKLYVQLASDLPACAQARL